MEELFKEILNPGINKIKSLKNEANELLAIIVASIKTARKNRNE